MLRSLAFLPPDEISCYYESFRNSIEDHQLKMLEDWFARNYIFSEKYIPEFWSVARESRKSLPRTQNSVEAWNRRLKVVVGKP